MRSGVAIIVLSSLLCLTEAENILDSELEVVAKTLKADMHFIDQLFEQVLTTKIRVPDYEEPEAIPYLAQGIARYISLISGGGPKKMAVVSKAQGATTGDGYNLDIYHGWYNWSVENICKRLVEAVEPVFKANDYNQIMGANEESLRLIAKMRVCRAIVNGDLMLDSFEALEREQPKRKSKLRDLLSL